MLFSYLLIHQKTNQMCHFANAPPFVRSLAVIITMHIDREMHTDIYMNVEKRIYCAKDSYRILTVN